MNDAKLQTLHEAVKAEDHVKGGAGGKAEPEGSLFFSLPRKFLDYTKAIPNVAAGMDSEKRELFGLTINSLEFIEGTKAGNGAKFKPDAMQVSAKDDSGRKIEFRVFGRVQPWRGLKVGQRILATAKLVSNNGWPKVEAAEVADGEIVGRIVPIYRGRAGIKAGKRIQEVIGSPAARKLAVERIMAEFEGLTEADVLRRARINVPSLDEFILSLHYPKTQSQAEEALAGARRLATLQVVCAGEALNQRPFIKSCAIPLQKDAIDELIAGLPFKLTQDQVYAIYDACGDMVEGRPMRRMLTGDVGTGKTIAYLLPAVAAHKAGAKVSMLMPNTLVADQVARECKEYFPDVHSALVRDKSKPKKEDLGKHTLFIGTTALNWLGLPKQDLVVIDEQAKFSRDQREALCHDGSHLLEVSATPIPRSMGLVMHGGMDMSFLRECPADKKITTKLLSPDDKKLVFREIQNFVNEGYQVAIIYPRTYVEEAKSELDGENEIELVDDGGEKSVEGAFAQWKRIMPDGDDVTMVHGKMKDKDKAEALQKDFRILIASTVVEVGVTKPKLACMLVVQPERLGVATLHQLRGRLVRHGGEGKFFMLPQTPLRPEQVERLQLLENHTDGFELAEQDMALRGFGDFCIEADTQSGASKSLFHELRLMPQDFMALQEEASKSARVKPG